MLRKKKRRLVDISHVISISFLSLVHRLLLRLLVIVILLGIVGGVIKTLLDLELLFHTSIEQSLRQLLLNVITLLAVVEIFKTAMSYLSEGRVKVTFIVDTVLIVMLNEVISLWFRGPTLNQVLILSMIIAVLIVVRLLAIKFSPDTE